MSNTPTDISNLVTATTKLTEEVALQKERLTSASSNASHNADLAAVSAISAASSAAEAKEIAGIDNVDEAVNARIGKYLQLPQCWFPADVGLKLLAGRGEATIFNGSPIPETNNATFTRNGIAYYNGNKYLANEPRFSGENKIIIEPLVTNLLSSGNMSSAGAFNANFTFNNDNADTGTVYTITPKADRIGLYSTAFKSVSLVNYFIEFQVKTSVDNVVIYMTDESPFGCQIGINQNTAVVSEFTTTKGCKLVSTSITTDGFIKIRLQAGTSSVVNNVPSITIATGNVSNVLVRSIFMCDKDYNFVPSLESQSSKQPDVCKVIGSTEFEWTSDNGGLSTYTFNQSDFTTEGGATIVDGVINVGAQSRDRAVLSLSTPLINNLTADAVITVTDIVGEVELIAYRSGSRTESVKLSKGTNHYYIGIGIRDFGKDSAITVFAKANSSIKFSISRVGVGCVSQSGEYVVIPNGNFRNIKGLL